VNNQVFSTLSAAHDLTDSFPRASRNVTVSESTLRNCPEIAYQENENTGFRPKFEIEAFLPILKPKEWKQ
jgi:hypothetical protein